MNREIERILVALDASPNSFAALAAAAELAKMLQAELSGLFVEDVVLLQMAELPLAFEVDRFTGAVHRIESAQVERQFRAQAERARRALEQAARRAQVQWSFRVARGPVATEVLAAAGGADLVTLGAGGWSETRRLGSTVQAVLDRAPCLTLVLGRAVRVPSDVFVPFDGSEGARLALDVAADLALGRRGRLTVLLPPVGDGDFQRLWTDVTVGLGGRGVRSEYLHVADFASGLADALKDAAGGVLVLPAGHGLMRDDAFAALLSRGRYSVLVVR